MAQQRNIRQEDYTDHAWLLPAAQPAGRDHWCSQHQWLTFLEKTIALAAVGNQPTAALIPAQ
ncbi:hypothetical protein LZ023_35535 (plasmid) [Pseudomonas silvicola]|nr:hypothetical protein LZ023_35535 [Pseudomonas silvicola]